MRKKVPEGLFFNPSGTEYSSGSVSQELKLSRIDGRWTVGPVQQWWRKYRKFLAGAEGRRSGVDYLEADADIKMEFSACLEQGEHHNRYQSSAT